MKLCRLIPLFAILLCSMARAGDVKVSVLVFGPGPESWQRFGHIAIRVNPDPRYRADVCYDWGRFDFEARGFFTKFIGGRMTYSMGPQFSADAIDFYKQTLDRTITECDLNLTDEEIRRLLIRIHKQDNDVDRFYSYDYFLNNCSTAIRDVIDEAVGGRLNATLESIPTESTFRSEMRRLMPVGLANHALLIGMDLAGGRNIDRKLNASEESFVPMRLGPHLQNVVLTDSDGSARRLVSETRVLNVANAAKSGGNFEPATESNPIWITGALGLLGTIKLAVLRRRRRLALITLGAWSALAGLMAIVICGGWFFTEHWAMRANENVLMFSPLWFLVLIGILWKRARQIARVTMMAIASLTIVALLMKLLPGNQTNWPALALGVPINLMGAVVLWKMKPKNPDESMSNPSTVAIG